MFLLHNLHFFRPAKSEQGIVHRAKESSVETAGDKVFKGSIIRPDSKDAPVINGTNIPI